MKNTKVGNEEWVSCSYDDDNPTCLMITGFWVNMNDCRMFGEYSVYQWVSELVGERMNVSQSVGQSYSQSVRQPASQSVSQSVRIQTLQMEESPVIYGPRFPHLIN
jgi:hypothetical protein